MKSCAHVEEVEELALGALDRADVTRVRAHLAQCEECREAHAMFEEERALFELRAEVAPALPPLAPIAIAAAHPHLGGFAPPNSLRRAWLEADTDRRGLFARFSPALVAAAACVAALVGAEELQRFRPDAVTCAPDSNQISGQISAPSGEEPIACALPVSGVVRVAQVSDDTLACAVPGASTDRATCEDPLASGLRVTYSMATP